MSLSRLTQTPLQHPAMTRLGGAEKPPPDPPAPSPPINPEVGWHSAGQDAMSLGRNNAAANGSTAAYAALGEHARLSGEGFGTTHQAAIEG
jgi:hypothetical protein